MPRAPKPWASAAATAGSAARLAARPQAQRGTEKRGEQTWRAREAAKSGAAHSYAALGPWECKRVIVKDMEASGASAHTKCALVSLALPPGGLLGQHIHRAL